MTCFSQGLEAQVLDQFPRPSHRSLKSDLARVDTHKVLPEEYDELPELTDEMRARATVNKGRRPVWPNPRNCRLM